MRLSEMNSKISNSQCLDPVLLVYVDNLDVQVLLEEMAFLAHQARKAVVENQVLLEMMVLPAASVLKALVANAV